MNTFILDSVNKSITAVMSGAAATTNPDFTAAYADRTATSLTEGANDGALNGTTPVTLVAAPAASTRRVVKSMTIHNRDTASVILTVNYVSTGGTRLIWKGTLMVGDTWTPEGVMDAHGNLRAMGGYAAWLAAADPTVNDDAADGFVIGSHWINTTSKREWVCVDTTVAAAVWLEITTPARTVAFLANVTSTISNVTGDSTSYDIVYNNEIFDLGNNFSTVTGQFTAPITGTYLLTVTVNLIGLSGHTASVAILRTSNRYIRQNFTLDGETSFPYNQSGIFDMDAGDIAWVAVVVSGGGAGKVVDVIGDASVLYNCFSGIRVA